jgi:hypothetical protein
MNTRFRIDIAMLLVIGLLSGCGKNSMAPGDPANVEESEVSSELATNPEYVDDGLSESSDPSEAEAAGGQAEMEAGPGSVGMEAAIRPIRFWRHITGVRRSFQFAFGDSDSTGRPTTAVVTVHKVFTGTFNIETGAREDSVFARSVIRKPLTDHWVRRILLHRVEVPELRGRQWRIVGLSGVQVSSRPAATEIVRLRFQAIGVDTTITDPLAFHRLRRVLRFDPDDSVTVTVTTLRNDDVVVVQHRARRLRFHNNGDNTYTGVFRAGFLAGVQHAGVNALSHGTLFDDQAPYDSQAWILPYIIKPGELRDYGV